MIFIFMFVWNPKPFRYSMFGMARHPFDVDIYRKMRRILVIILSFIEKISLVDMWWYDEREKVSTRVWNTGAYIWNTSKVKQCRVIIGSNLLIEASISIRLNSLTLSKHSMPGYPVVCCWQVVYCLAVSMRSTTIRSTIPYTLFEVSISRQHRLIKNDVKNGATYPFSCYLCGCEISILHLSPLALH